MFKVFIYRYMKYKYYYNATTVLQRQTLYLSFTFRAGSRFQLLATSAVQQYIVNIL